MQISLLNYGIGNIECLKGCIRSLGHKIQLINDYDSIIDAEILLLPGVGSFPAAMRYLTATGLDFAIKKRHDINKPIIGICLGMQLLAYESDEFMMTKGLGILDGAVKKLPFSHHICWNSISSKKSKDMYGISSSDYFYFNHSYHFVGNEDQVIYDVHYGIRFTAGVKLGNTIGLQFHPEKSQASGKRLLKNIFDSFDNE